MKTKTKAPTKAPEKKAPTTVAPKAKPLGSRPPVRVKRSTVMGGTTNTVSNSAGSTFIKAVPQEVLGAEMRLNENRDFQKLCLAMHKFLDTFKRVTQCDSGTRLNPECTICSAIKGCKEILNSMVVVDPA